MLTCEPDWAWKKSRGFQLRWETLLLYVSQRSDYNSFPYCRRFFRLRPGRRKVDKDLSSRRPEVGACADRAK